MRPVLQLHSLMFQAFFFIKVGLDDGYDRRTVTYPCNQDFVRQTWEYFYEEDTLKRKL